MTTYSKNILIYLKNKNNPTLEEKILKDEKLIVYTYEAAFKSIKGFYLVYFTPRARKAKGFSVFTTIEKRENHLEKLIQKHKDILKEKTTARAERNLKKNSLADKIQEGTILSDSWGYDQTNVDMFQVIKKTSKHTCIIRKIAQKKVDGSEQFDSCKVVADVDNFIGEELKKRIGNYGIKINESVTVSPTTAEKEHYCSWGR